MKSKRGSHVGMILSFVIFVTFLIFLYSILQPSIKIKGDKEDLLNNLKIELTEKFSADWGIITLVINIATKKDCVNLEGLISQLPSSRIILKNESSDIPDGVVIDEKDINNLLIKRFSIDNVFFKIYHSEEFDELIIGKIPSCDDVSEEEYAFESIDTGKEIFYSKINQTKNEYETNYTALKDELNIPDGAEFGFVFMDKKRETLIVTKEKNVSISVYAEEIPILYVDNEANINSGFLIIKVW